MKPLFTFLALLTLMVGAAFAQDAPPATVEVGSFKLTPYVAGSFTSAPGNNNLNFVFGGGVEDNAKHFLLDGNGVISTNNSYIGAGTTATFTASDYYKYDRHLLVGGGLYLVIADGFSAKNYSNGDVFVLNPFLGAGWQAKRYRVIGDYTFLKAGGLPGFRAVDFHGEYFVTQHFRATASIGVTSFDNGFNDRTEKTQIGAGVKYLF